MALRDYLNTGNTSSVGTFGSDWNSMTFTASASYSISSVKLLLFTAGGSPGTVTVAIRATSGGAPTGANLTSGTTNGNTLTETPEWREINFSSSYGLSSGTVYAIVVSCTASAPGDLLAWSCSEVDEYAGGNNYYSTDSGSSWLDGAPYDCLFETYDTLSNSDAIVRMIPFVYSTSIAYQCEFRDSYIRFYYNDAVLQDGGSDVWIASPYVEADLYELQYYQIGDTMWIVHPSYKPRKLTRTSATTFSLDVIEYNKGPFLTRNDLIDTTVKKVASMSYNAGTLTCDGEVFESGHVGALFKLTHPRPVTNISQSGSGTSDPISGKGTYTLITRGTWTGTMEIRRNDNETGWYTFRTYKSSSGAEQNIKESFKEEDDNVQYRLYANTSASFRADLSIQDYLQDSIVKITAITSSQIATATPIVPVPSTDPTKRWAEGAWSSVRTYPSSITFYNDRCVLAGQQAIPEQILKKPGDPE